MKKFNFKFQKILEYKECIEDKNRIFFNMQLAVYNEEQITLNTLVEKRDHLNNERNSNLSSTTIKDLKIFNQYCLDINETIDYQKDVVLEREKDVDNAKKKLLESVKEKKTFEKLKDKCYDRYLFEVKKDEEKLVDQLVSFKNGVR